MATKAEITAQFIIEKVAPVFNKMGYEATSMSDITNVTGLTKGAIYGNFKNKEHLAMEAFNYNVRTIVWKVADRINAEETTVGKLKALTGFYRSYYTYVIDFGGCPLMNVGIDSNNLNPQFHARVVELMDKLENNLAVVINEGMKRGELKPDLDPQLLAGRFFSHIQGAIFTAVMTRTPSKLTEMMDFLDDLIDKELVK